MPDLFPLSEVVVTVRLRQFQCENSGHQGISSIEADLSGHNFQKPLILASIALFPQTVR